MIKEAFCVVLQYLLLGNHTIDTLTKWKTLDKWRHQRVKTGMDIASDEGVRTC